MSYSGISAILYGIPWYFQGVYTVFSLYSSGALISEGESSN